MSDPVAALLVDLLEWIEAGPRPYDEVMSAWRTSCPRLPVWEEATERGLLEHTGGAGAASLVAITPLGRAHLAGVRAEAQRRKAACISARA